MALSEDKPAIERDAEGRAGTAAPLIGRAQESTRDMAVPLQPNENA